MNNNGSILKTTFLFLAMLVYGLGYSQSCCDKKLAECSKKGTADCPIIKDCPKKGTADCPYIKADNSSASAEMANCPLKGTADCPLIKNCPKKGTADCPYTRSEASTTAAVSKTEGEIRACCKKKH